MAGRLRLPTVPAPASVVRGWRVMARWMNSTATWDSCSRWWPMSRLRRCCWRCRGRSSAWEPCWPHRLRLPMQYAMPSPTSRYMRWSILSTSCMTDCRPGADSPFPEAPRQPHKPRCAGLSAAGQNAASAPLPRWREKWILACWPTSTA